MPGPQRDTWLDATRDQRTLARFARGRARHDVREVVTEMLADGSSLDALSLQRLKVRPGASIEAWFAASVRSPVGQVRRHVAARWSNGAEPAAPPSSGSSGDGFALLRAGSSPAVSVSPYDPAFPNLVPLLSTSHVAAALGLDPSAGLSTRTVRYRPGQRHVLRFVIGTDARVGTTTWFAKLERPGRGSEAFDAASRFARSVDGDPGVAVVGPVALVDDALLYPAVRGRALSSTSPATVQATLGLARAGRALAVVHDASLPAGRAPRTIADELSTTGRSIRHLRAWLGVERARLDDLVARLGALVPVVGVGPIVSLHGDCKLDHLHRGGSVMHLIDIDNAGPGDAALDIGNLLADVRWWAGRAPREVVEASVRAVVVAYGPLASSPGVDLVEALSLLRITARRTRPDRADWTTQTTAGIAEVEHLASQLELRLGR